ncbi:MAG: TrmH family RNA methyltransferase [Bacteroidota bacterium]|nr:TrmH family RNA methyltransferase [Bacteroidota bacterium]
MISKASVKYIKSLQDKKQRQKYDHFVVEGEKSIAELLKSHFKIHKVFVTDLLLDDYKNTIDNQLIFNISKEDLNLISFHQTPQNALAIVEIPKQKTIQVDDGFVLALDEIQDPGNLGTIIRIADWYGIKQIVCSKGCTDVYSPKVINASMGSFVRVNVVYDDILKFAKQFELPLLVTTFNGTDVHQFDSTNKGLIVIGNEGHGINNEIIKQSNFQLTIPKYGGAESLNAAISTAIVLDNLIGR